MAEPVRARVVIRGLVQGVFFRQTAAERARTRGLRGWVRNRSDGRVEAVFEGDPDAVSSMVEWCRTGPRHARVDGIEVEWGEPGEAPEPFEIRG